jgi:hypothetical protein
MSNTSDKGTSTCDLKNDDALFGVATTIDNCSENCWYKINRCYATKKDSGNVAGTKCSDE